jgi:hypothetical protein
MIEKKYEDCIIMRFFYKKDKNHVPKFYKYLYKKNHLNFKPAIYTHNFFTLDQLVILYNELYIFVFYISDCRLRDGPSTNQAINYDLWIIKPPERRCNKF